MRWDQVDVSGRPKKKADELRRKWDVLNVTSAERATIKENAQAVGLGLSAYIIQCALRRPPVPRQDWHRIVRQQAQLLQRLDDLAAALVVADDVRDEGRALLALRQIEAEIASWTSRPDADDDSGCDGADEGQCEEAPGC
jgi:hypothetical protein